MSNIVFPDFSYEEELLGKGYTPCGVDEVGYGSLAYGITVAAVIVPIKVLHYFETNVGYGTKAHKNGIVKYGVTPIHRKTFKEVCEYI